LRRFTHSELSRDHGLDRKAASILCTEYRYYQGEGTVALLFIIYQRFSSRILRILAVIYGRGRCTWFCIDASMYWWREFLILSFDTALLKSLGDALELTHKRPGSPRPGLDHQQAAGEKKLLLQMIIDLISSRSDPPLERLGSE
jgi:hypothetical protein